jgi:uncharacterized protein YjdB
MKRLVAAVAALAACGPVVDRVEVTPRKVSLEAVGAAVQLQAVAHAPDGAALRGVAVRWRSQTPEVARVDAGGRVTAVRSGSALILASAARAAAQVPVEVSIPVRAALEPGVLDLVGIPRSGQLALRVQDENGRLLAPTGAAWSSSDEGVVQVSPGGAVTSVGPGKATVAVRVAGLRAVAEVTVRYPEFARILVRPPRLSLRVGETVRLAGEAVDGDGAAVAGVPIGFASSSEAVLRVGGDGSATGVARGKARVLVAGGSRSAAVEVTVRK